jgi:hypothetical protein
MPLTTKGSKIKSALQKEYGAKRGESILYAGKNKGTFTGIDQDTPISSTIPNVSQMSSTGKTSFDAKTVDRIKRHKSWDRARPALTKWRDEIVKEFSGEKSKTSSGYDARQFSTGNKKRSMLGKLWGAKQRGMSARDAIADCAKDCSCEH